MKARFLIAIAIALILLSLPALVLAQGPVVSTGPSGEGIEGAPLGSPDALWDQPSDGGNIASSYFPDFGYGFYSADDFSNANPWNILSIFVPGYSYDPPSLSAADSLHWLIYPDVGGVPAGYPGAGGELWSYSCKPGDPEVTISGTSSEDVTLDILMAQGAPLHLPPGTYWLCFYPTLDFGLYGQWWWETSGTTNLAVARFLDPTDYFSSGWTDWTPISTVLSDPSSHDLAFRIEGTAVHPATPSNLKYLHCTGGLFNLTDPLDTQWHELWPIFCREYHLGSWEDNGDGILSYCDTIDMYEKPDGELRPYHVENVTITLLVALPNNHAQNGTSPPPQGNELPQEAMYIELMGGYNESVLMNPVGTLWHEVHPKFCRTYNLTGWMDNDSRTLDWCDGILLMDKGTGEESWWHVEEVSVDIIVTPEPPPVGGEAYPVSKTPLLAPWIALAVFVAAGTGVLVLRRRRT